jgi:tight adherence protein C
MRSQLALALGLLLGWMLLLGSLRSLRRPSLLRRLERRLDGAADDVPSRQALRRTRSGDRLGGTRESRLDWRRGGLRGRLERAGSEATPRQLAIGTLACATAGLVFGVLVSTATTSTALRLALALLGAAIGSLAPFGFLEQRATRRQAERTDAFPLLVEHLAMLAGHGFAVPEAFWRLERRWRDTTVGADLRALCRRMAQGAEPAVAVADWAEAHRFPPGERLADALAATATSSDCERVLWQLGRAERERHLAELVRRFQVREQQVWIPVTVAAFVPGMLLLVLPFARALHALGAA